VSQLAWLSEVRGDPYLLDMALRFFAFERRVPFSALVRTSPGDLHYPAGFGGAFRAQPGETAVLDVTFPRPTSFDRIGVITSERFPAPAQVVVEAGVERRSIQPGRRLMTVEMDVQDVRSARITFVPPRGAATGAGLVTFSNPDVRSLSAVSSDLSVYSFSPEQRWERDPRNLYDGDPSTTWSTSAPATLTLALGDAGYRWIEPVRCARARAFSWSFSSNLVDWTPSVAIDATPGGKISVFPDAKYARLSWAGRACLAELNGSVLPRV
jgi:hypothetical protein